MNASIHWLAREMGVLAKMIGAIVPMEVLRLELKGKIINFLGDSITDGAGVAEEENRYYNVIKRWTGLKAANNYGIGGTKYAYQSKPSSCPVFDLYFCGRAYRMDSDADIIVVFGGTNDYGGGDAPYGEMSDTMPTTFCGAVEYLMNMLTETYPKAQLVFMTPTRRKNDLFPAVHPNKCADAKPLRAYVDVIIEKGKQHGISVLDLYDKLGIDLNKDEDMAKYSEDGVHLNDAAHLMIAERLLEVLQSL